MGEGNPSDANIKEIMKLGIGKCKLCVQAPAHLNSTDAADFVGTQIVTSFPHLARRFFTQLDSAEVPTTKIKVISGSVEAACTLGLADAIVDLVETGTTMRAAGLEIVSEVFASEAVLIRQRAEPRPRRRPSKSIPDCDEPT